MKPRLFKLLQATTAGLYVFIALHTGLVLADPAVDALPQFQNIPDPTIADAVQNGNVLDINIRQDRAILDFSTHDIGANATVNYNGNTNFHVLGNIHDQSASQIFGTLNSDVNLTLINKYGFIFGPDSVVNASSLTASAINSAFPFDVNDIERRDQADFTTFAAEEFDQAVEVYTGTIDIQQGAQITANGGNLFFLAPQSVKNDGKLTANDGQVILAAGSKIYLAQPDSASNESNILVEVEITNDHINAINASNADETDDFENLLVGHVENAVGEIFADRGVITLLGASVHNNGTLSASTSVKQGGKIRLLAGSDLEDVILSENEADVASVFDHEDIGLITLGSNSIIIASPDTSDRSTAVEEDVQPQGEIEFLGKKITFGSGSNTVARSGDVNIYNLESQNSQSIQTLSTSDEAKYSDFEVVVDNGAKINVSGIDTKTSVAKNFVEAELLSNELADSTLAKNNQALRDVLREGPVTIDARKVVTVDGEDFEGTALGDVSGFIDLIEYNVAERSVDGGNINIQSRNSVDIKNNANLDVSGGSIEFTADKIITTKLVEQGTNRIVDIGDARSDRNYISVLDMDTVLGRRIVNATPAIAGYVDGKSAGTLTINAEQIISPLTTSNITAETRVGDFQIEPGLEVINSNRPSLSRFTPRGAALVLGNSNITSDNFRQFAARLSDIVLDKSFSAALDDTAQISTDLFAQSNRNGNRYINFTQLDATASDAISIQSNITAAGEANIDLTARVINVLADVAAPSGSVNLQVMESADGDILNEPSIFINSNSQIDLSGNFINRNTDQLTPKYIDGGNFTVGFFGDTDGSLSIESGAQINVSGGVEFERNLVGLQNVNLGQGGSIDLDVTELGQGSDDNVSIENLLTAFKGYGVSANNSVSSGGSFRYRTDDNLCISSAACDFEFTASDADTIQSFTPSFFTQNGFSSFTVGTTRGELVLNEALTLKPLVNRIQVNGSGFSTAIEQPIELFSKPVSLNLSSAGQFYFDDSASINTVVNSSINFGGSNLMYIGGKINAKSGDIRFSLTGAANNEFGDNGSFDNSISLWFSDNAWIDVGSTAITRPVNGFNVGNVYGSGSITANSQRGYIVVEEGAKFLSDGIATTIDQQNLLGAFVPTTIATAGGDLTISAGERIFYSSSAGNFSVKAGSSQTAGGTLSFLIDPTNRGANSDLDTVAINLNDYPLRHAQYLLTSDTYNPFIGINLEFRDAIESVTGQNGDVFTTGVIQGDNAVATTIISTEMIALSGADNLSLKTVDVALNDANQNQLPSLRYRQGQILLDDGLDLSLDGLLTLNTSELIMPDEQQTNANINVFALRLGSSNTDTNRIFPGFNQEFLSANFTDVFTLKSPTVDDNQSLVLNAGVIDIFGDSVINNIRSFTLNSLTDIRLIGLPQQNASGNSTSTRTSDDLIGSLQMLDVDLNLSAQQIYPTTLTDFTLSNIGDDSSVTTSSPNTGVIPLTPYSVAGELDIITRRLTHGGVLRAPEGAIRLSGDVSDMATIEILADAVLSVSANGAVIPFAQTLIDQFPIIEFQGAQYVQSGLLDSDAIVSGSLLFDAENIDLLQEKQVELSANSITLEEGSLLNLSGGGVLLSTQFNSGLLGTRDIIRSNTQTNTFALAPVTAVNSLAAPIDPSIPAGFDIEYGETVSFTSNALGLPAGTYVKLPAEYALLPGHLLVEEVSGFEGIRQDDVISQLDGSIVIAGADGLSNGLSLSTSLKAYKIQNRAVIDRRADYTTFNFGQLIENVIQPSIDRVLRTTEDDGRLQLTAGDQLLLDGNIFADQLDISSNFIRIVDDAFNQDIADTLILKQSQLRDLSVDSILLGGNRFNSNQGAIGINVNTQSVEFDAGVDLDVSELIVVAIGDDGIQINDDVRIFANSDQTITQEFLQAPSEGSILVVSDVTNWQVKLPEVPQFNSNNKIHVGNNVSVNGAASVVIGSVNQFDIAQTANLSASQGTLSLMSSEINILGGNAILPANGGMVFADSLSSYDANNVALLAPLGINLLGDVQVQRQNLALQTSSINAVEGVGGQASNSRLDISDRLELGGSSRLVNVATGTGTASFNVGNEIQFTGDIINFNGFSADDSLTFDSQIVRVTNDSILNFAGGFNLNVNDVRFGIGTDLIINTLGGVSIGRSTQAVDISNIISDQVPSLFSQFTLNAENDVTIDTKFSLNSGNFQINTNGSNVVFGDQTQIDLSGRLISIGEKVIPTDGGWMIIDSAGGNIQFSEDLSTGQLTVNLDASEGGNAGLLALFADTGDIDLNQSISANSVGGKGGAFIMDEGEITPEEFSALNSQLNTNGFTKERSLRSRSGNFDLSATDEIIAEKVRLIADQGDINIAGTITADSDQGSYVGLFAQQNVTLQEGGVISARLLTNDQFSESRLVMSSRAGTVSLENNSQINLSRFVNGVNAGNGGDIYIRADRGIDSDGINGADSVAATIQQANEVFVSEVASTIEGDNSITVSGFAEYIADTVDQPLIDTIRADTNVFGTVIDSISARLSSAGNQVFVIPGIEIQSENTINLTSDWNFNDWRFGNLQVAPDLVIASTNNIEIGSEGNPIILSDGLDDNLAILSDEFNTSFTLVAGSDLSSADITQTLRSPTDLANLGSIIIADGQAAVVGDSGPVIIDVPLFGISQPFDGSQFDNDPSSPATIDDCNSSAIVTGGFGTCSGGGSSSPLRQSGVRSGTGDISLIAANDIEFGNEYSAVYTAGRKVGVEDVDFFTLDGIANLAYGEQGGNITISAGNNIIGAVSNTFVNDWIWKTDQATIGTNSDSGTIGWAANPSAFTGDVAALGGGNIYVEAGTNISQLDVSIASIGKQVGASQRVQADSQLEVVGGGNLHIHAGGDITNPKLYVGKGRANIHSQGSVGDAQNGGAIVLLGDSQFDITARNELYIERVFNPTILESSQTQLESITTGFDLSNIGARFFTYSDKSAINLQSNTGVLSYNTDNINLQQVTGIVDASSNEISTLPGIVNFTALNNDIFLGDNGDRLIMFPNSQGNFEFISGANILVDGIITQLDLPDSLIPTVNSSINIERSVAGSIQNQAISIFPTISDLLGYTIISNRSPAAVIDSYRLRVSNRHAGISENGLVDNLNSRLMAINSIIFSGNTDIGISTAEATDLIAGKDIINPNVQIQNVNEYDISQLSAGGSINTAFRLDDSGQFFNSDTFSGIFVDGPGRLDIITGDQINLGASQGILSRANTFNPFLTNNPATINILSGFTDFDLRVNNFISTYIDIGPEESIYDEFINDFLISLSQGANQTYGTLITDEFDLTQYQTLSQNALASPFLDLSAEDLQVLNQLGNGSSFDNTQLRNLFLSLSESQQFDVVLQAFNNEIFTGGQAAVLATDIGLGTAGFYAGYLQSFDAIRTLFPEHAGALNLLQQQIGSGAGLVGVDTANPALVSFINELNTALTKLPETQQDAVIEQIQSNIGNGINLTTAINQPLASNGIVNDSGVLIQISEGVANLVNSANNVEGSEIADFVQSLQLQNDALFSENVSNVSTPFNLVGGEVGGDINVLVPFGFYNVGGNIDNSELGLARSAGEQGIISGGGAINMFLGGDLFVNLQRVVGIGDEALNLFSLFDNIDAGSGAKTTIAVSPATYTFDLQGQRLVTFSPSFSGSGIRKLEDADGNLAPPGLFTPYGIVDAGDAGIVSDSGISIAALDVQNDTQISQGGESGATSAPVAPSTPTVDAGASNAATNTASSDAVGADSGDEQEANAFSDDAAAFLNVFVIGVGDDSEGSSGFDSASAGGVNTSTDESEENNNYDQSGCRPDENGVTPENCISSL